MGGLLVAAAGWRAVLLVNLPIGIAGTALAGRVLPRSRGRRREIDAAGILTSVVALTGLTLALIEGRALGYGSPLVLAALAMFLAAGIAFCAVEMRVDDPMLPLRAMQARGVAGGTSVGFLINLGFYGELLLLSLYLQRVGHLSALQAGLPLLPQMAMAVVGSMLSGRVMARTGARLAMLIGLAVGAGGLFAVAAVTGRPPSLMIAAPTVAAGLGMSFTMPAATAAVLGRSPAEHAGLAAGVVNAARQVGGLVGVALLPALAAGLGQFRTGLPVSIGLAGAAFVVALGGPSRSALSGPRRGAPEQHPHSLLAPPLRDQCRRR